MADKSFYWYFKTNMNEMGLPAPESLFGQAATAMGFLGAVSGALDKFGPNATIKTVLNPAKVGAGGLAVSTFSRLILYFGAISASFYLGAAAGSLLVATNRKMDLELTTADIIYFLGTKGFVDPRWVRHGVTANPQICNRSMRYKVTQVMSGN